MSHWLPEPAATEQQRKNYRRGRLRAFIGVLADTSPRMSFSDYGSKRSGTNKAAVAPQLASTGTGTGLSKISDVLSQYQVSSFVIDYTKRVSKFRLRRMWEYLRNWRTLFKIDLQRQKLNSSVMRRLTFFNSSKINQKACCQILVLELLNR